MTYAEVAELWKVTKAGKIKEGRVFNERTGSVRVTVREMNESHGPKAEFQS